MQSIYAQSFYLGSNTKGSGSSTLHLWFQSFRNEQNYIKWMQKIILNASKLRWQLQVWKNSWMCTEFTCTTLHNKWLVDEKKKTNHSNATAIALSVCHWHLTLECGCLLSPDILIHYNTDFLFAYSKLTTLLYKNYIHCSSMYIVPCFSPKQNGALSKMLPWRKASKVFTVRTCFRGIFLG